MMNLAQLWQDPANKQTWRLTIRIFRSSALAFLASCLLTSCSTAVKQVAVGASWKALDHNYPAGEYKMQIGDELTIKFFERPQMNEDVTVRPDGKISPQLLNDVVAMDKTARQLAAELEIQYRKEITGVRVAVVIRSFSAQKAFVAGEVNKSQQVELRGTTTLLQAISQAGGLTPTAHADQVIIIRRLAHSSPDVRTVNLASVIDGTDVSQDIVLLPNDIIVVPRSRIGNVNVWVDQYVRKLIPFSSVGLSFRGY
jgi:protein involved in polysaccharide export with SLBB domain